VIDDETRAILSGMRATIDRLLADPAPPPASAVESERMYLSPEEYAVKVGLTSRTVRKKIKSREIEARRFGRRWRIPVSELTRERHAVATRRPSSGTVAARKGAIQ
jgi:excisionase family DNA binding protein